ncbi:MAG: NAD(P)H-hydrate dehydratase [Muribaculaceae bacterium]|nr:NAD(P)H-hydrate dehydratase [Bacteroides sp.]MDE6679884.1 NAD(P)H-hydrate dehydratase [Muribaculaceae bacterium]MDE6843183.1 NAD(P)H-hydrate dehydratase [Muribaculaceae bacterium]
MKIFTSDNIPIINSATCETESIESADLMERAALAVSCELISLFVPSRRIVIIAGPGNNGGKALTVARKLIEQGYKKVEVFLFNVKNKLSHDCEHARKLLTELEEEVDFTEVKREFTPPYLSPNDVVVDGLFGSGLKQPLAGGFIAVARYINESGAYVISIDMPSGMFCEWNDNVTRRDMVHANMTLALQFPRLSFFFEENEQVLGDWKLLDIDLNLHKMKELPTDYMFVESRSVRPLLRPRNKFTGKRNYGSALLIAGSTGMMGAAVMCARATLKSGAGLVTVHSAHRGLEILQTAVPEAMFEPDRGEHIITDMKVHHDHQVVAVGPGIGTQDSTIDALETLLKTTKLRLLLDADALNCISKRPALLTMLPPKTIISPHVGEFDRLFGEQKSSEARLRKAVEVAKYYNIIIVLKGHYTATIRPTGKVYFNSTGNPGMATAGAGDVLTGVIAAFLAQGYLPEQAATIGVYIHGLAGDLAVAETGEYGLMASDIANNLGVAIRHIMERKPIPSEEVFNIN